MEIEKGKDYSWGQISTLADENDSFVGEYGDNVIGQNLVVVDTSNKTYSFLLTGVMGGSYIYTCVYAE
jgi:hypothetical protein